MKLHRHLVQQLILTLVEIFAEQRPADKIIEKTFKKNTKWGSRDRKFFAETTYSIIRNLRRLWVLAGLEPRTRESFRGVSAREFWALWFAYAHEQGWEIPPWEELAGLAKPTAVKLTRAEAHSVPNWLDQLGAETWGADWEKVLGGLNIPADVYLRPNTLKTTLDGAIQALAKSEIVADKVPNVPSALKLRERKNIFVTPGFKEGLYEVQDAASQTVAPLLDVKPGERVVDACAGGGGKTLHLAAMMKNKGTLIAMDIHQWKLDELKTRARRAGAAIIETRLIDSTKVIKRLEESADAVLLDVPCSGLGVLRRNPDAKWRLTPEEIARLQQLQSELLMSYSRMVKPGGRLVYATCSILPSENQAQVQKFLKSEKGAGWVLVRDFHHRPDVDGFDGFYAALLTRAQA